MTDTMNTAIIVRDTLITTVGIRMRSSAKIVGELYISSV